MATKIKSDGKTITVRVPISIRKRGGRKVVLAPDGVCADPTKLLHQQADATIAKALARAFRWRELLEDGTYSTIDELAEAEGINDSYVGRILRLTLLSPSLIDDLVFRGGSEKLDLKRLMKPFPIEWEMQGVSLLSD